MTNPPVGRVPYALRKEVSISGRQPRDIVMDAIRTSPSATAAAMKLGVTTLTLNKWKRLYRIDAKSSSAS